jgi:hypothetical protein
MKPPRISKAVAKVLDELWPIARKASSENGGTASEPTWRRGFKRIGAASRAVWITVAEWHLKELKLAAKSKEGR